MSLKEAEPATKEPRYRAAQSMASAEQRSGDDSITTTQLTQLQLVWIRFRRHRLAMIGSGILLFMTLMAVFAPIISPENIYDNMSNDVFGQTDQAPNLSQGLRYIFGSDFNNRSMSSQIFFGARYSLLIGFSAAMLSTVIGVVVGAVSGYFGGWLDSVLMRIVDIFLTLPGLQVLIVAASVFGGGHTSVLLIIAIFTFFGWAFIARLVRGLYLSLRVQEFAEAARAVGVSTPRIIFRHLLPSTLRPVLVATTLAVAGNIVGEATIDFLGFGLQYPDTSWGSVLEFGRQEQFQHWWLTTFPGIFLVLTVVAVNFLGDGLSDALDVRSKPI